MRKLVVRQILRRYAWSDPTQGPDPTQGRRDAGTRSYAGTQGRRDQILRRDAGTQGRRE